MVPPAGVPGSFDAGVFRHAGASHTYKLHLPPGSLGRRPLGLLVMLHGCGQDPDDFAAGTRMNALARRQRLAVLYPAQSREANRHGCWNWYLPQHQGKQGEPAWIAALTRSLVRSLHTDSRRVFIAGLSAGGAMAATVARAYPELFAACGVHSGLAAGTAEGVIDALAAMRSGTRCMPRGAHRLVPTIVFHGERDETVHPRHARHLVDAALLASRPGRKSGAADPAPSTQALDHDVGSRILYRDGLGRLIAERWQLDRLGHAWSGGSAAGSHTDPQGPDASAQFLRFFQEVAPSPRTVAQALATGPTRLRKLAVPRSVADSALAA